MRTVRVLLITILLLIASSFFLMQLSINKSKSTNFKLSELPNLTQIQPIKQSKEIIDLFQGDLFNLMNKSEEEVKDIMTKEADDIFLSAFGYDWHIYENSLDDYVQIGIDEGMVKTIYGTGNNLSISPFEIGMSYEEVEELFTFKNKITYEEAASFFTFILNDEELNTYPLIKISDDLFIQCYFDIHTEELSSVRLVTGELLLRQGIYEMEYRGKLPDKSSYTSEEWEEVNNGIAQQIFTISNMYRNRFQLKPLIYSDTLSDVALGHSKDMAKNNYFSHNRPDGSGLKERLSEGEVLYLMAGENIAAFHADGPAAVEGWLNSLDHRDALLHKEYTHLGVGVHDFHYTQNFIKK